MGTDGKFLYVDSGGVTEYSYTVFMLGLLDLTSL